MFKWVMAGKAEKVRTALDSVMDERKLSELKDDEMKDVARVMCAAIDEMCSYKGGASEVVMRQLRELRRNIMNQRRSMYANNGRVFRRYHISVR